MEALTNFCLEPFINHLLSSSVSADGYAPTNLTSTNAQIRARGFRVEHFIRPPVSIDFVFKVPVHVACILLKPDLETNSEVRFVLAGSSHVPSQKPNSAADGYEFTQSLQSGVAVKGPNVVVHFKNRAYDRMWPHKIDISSETVSMVTGSYLNGDLCEAHIIEQPIKYLNIASRLRQLKVTATMLTGVKPYALRCIEVWGTLAGTSNHSEKVAFGAALGCLEANPYSAIPQLSLGVFNHHSLSPLDSVDQRQPNGVIASNDLHKVKDNSVISSVTPPNCFPLDSLTCGSLGKPTQSKPCPSQSSKHAWPNRPTLTGQLINNLTTKLSVVKPALMETLPHYERPCGKRGITFPQASGHYSAKKPKMEASELAQDSWKPLTCVGHTSSSSGCEEQTLHCNHNSRPLSKCTTCSLKQTNSYHPSDGIVNDQCIPSKFLDSITCDVMLLPMLLPSGHLVDRSTVDKLALNDTMYGRLPTDPFTGVAFSERCRPEFCPQLKIEIDAYLTTGKSKYSNEKDNPNSEHTRDGEDKIAKGRTVGGALDISKHLKMAQKSSFGAINKSHPVSCGMSLRTDPVEGPSCTTKQYSTVGQQGYDYISPTSMRHEPVDRKLEHVSKKERDRIGSFENEVSDSLDEALHQLFSS